MSDQIVNLSNLTKRWGPVIALDNVSLDVKQGEILTLLGPSGCGKTTLMRIVAGFEQPTAGTVMIDGVSMTGVPPERRPVNMVFQRYALFPHLDVFDNIAFGLRLRKVSKETIRTEVTEMLKLVQLGDFGSRWINEVSGGQAQRVALARALINRPKVLLLDEPLAALDLKIRHHMLGELKRIHAETGTTFIYVTHDQDEAMILSDRVVLMNKGTIEQIGSPDEMYGAPRTLFCARFFGETNIVAGTVGRNGGGEVFIESDWGPFVMHDSRVKAGDRVYLSVRPESIRIDGGNGTGLAANRALGVVDDVTFIGSRILYQIKERSGASLKCQEPRTTAGIRFKPGSSVTLSWDAAAPVVLFD